MPRVRRKAKARAEHLTAFQLKRAIKYQFIDEVEGRALLAKLERDRENAKTNG